MAERQVEQVIEDERRQAVSNIAQAGREAQNSVGNTSRGMANAGASFMRDQALAASPYGGGDIARELQAILSPANQIAGTWGRDNANFEAGNYRDMQGSAGDFFAGARTATPIVQQHADAERAAAEAELLNAVLQQELGAGTAMFGFKQALEQRARAREQMEFQRQAHAQQMQMAQEQLAFQREEAARAAAESAAASQPQPAPTTSGSSGYTYGPEPATAPSPATNKRSGWTGTSGKRGWGR